MMTPTWEVFTYESGESVRVFWARCTATLLKKSGGLYPSFGMTSISTWAQLAQDQPPVTAEDVIQQIAEKLLAKERLPYVVVAGLPVFCDACCPEGEAYLIHLGGLINATPHTCAKLMGLPLLHAKETL